MESKKPVQHRIPSKLLQWGHNVLAVERCGLDRATVYKFSLQWGHNVLAVESLGRLAKVHTIQIAFNGATTYSLWKVAATGKSAEHSRFLQWGHNVLAVESNGGSYAAVKPSTFNGATTYSLWKVSASLSLMMSQYSPSMGPQRTRCGKGGGLNNYEARRAPFNGATTYSLWKAVPVIVICLATALPSMGPQRTRCGKPCKCKEFKEPENLQWGHNVLAVESSSNTAAGDPPDLTFNGATTYSLWKEVGISGSDQPIFCLQWGHNVLAVESSATHTPHARWCPPSMGPQRTRCGKSARRTAVNRRAKPPSMGPQRTRCGKFAGVESWTRRLGPFNGATTYSLWKDECSRLGHIDGETLQWGHNVLAVESSTPLPVDRGSCTAFNGATTYSLWKDHGVHHGDHVGVHPSMGPQRTRCGKKRQTDLTPICLYLLQWGHNVLAVESG